MLRNSRSFVFVAVAVLCLTAFGQVSFGQNRSTISGFVFTPERTPIPEIYVELLNEVNSVLQRVRTNGSGRYYFSGLSSGRFTIRVMSTGTNMEGQPEDVEIAGIGMTGRQLADNVQKDMYLHYRKGNNDASQLTGVIYGQSVPTEAQDAYKSAVSDLKNNKTDAGIEGLHRALSIFPTYLVALEKLGMTRLAQEKYDEAKNAFARAISVYDRSFSSWYGLGYSTYALKEYDKAIPALERAVTIQPDSMNGFFFLGLAYRQIKEYPKAESALLKAVKASDGNAPDVHWNLALLYAHNLERFTDAADQLELYLKQSPDLSNKGLIKKLIKQYRDKGKA